MLLGKVKVFLGMIKFEHTIFALPFAFTGALLGSVEVNGHLPSWAEIGWIILAMVGARSAAMGLNRIIDRFIDAKNPRTANRAIPAGLISAKEAVFFVAVSFFLLFIAASQLHPICLPLLPIAVFFLVVYSYTKRFTWTCHLILGLTIGLAPLGGWVAVTGVINGAALLLYLSVAFWTAGFDVIYACQDVEFDRKEGLHSIPSRFGVAIALKAAKSFHVLTGIGLAVLFFLTELGWVYFLGMLIALGILFYEHRLVAPNDLSRLNTAFFTMNGTLSVIIFVFTMVDLMIFKR